MEAEIFTKRNGESIHLKCMFTRKYIICDFEVINLVSERFSYKSVLEDSTPIVYQENKYLTNHLTI